MKYEKPELIINIFESEICTAESGVAAPTPKGSEFIDTTSIQQDKVSYALKFVV